jgi:hypothetical protein
VIRASSVVIEHQGQDQELLAPPMLTQMGIVPADVIAAKNRRFDFRGC